MKKNLSPFAVLQRGLTGERSFIGESYMDDPGMLSAYLDYYWPVSRSQAAHAIEISFCSRHPVKKLIDIGSGPGPLAAAFIDAGAEDIVLVDKSRRALELALRELPRRCTRKARLTSVVADIASLESSKISFWGEADCISFGHSLNELYADDDDRIEKRTALLEKYAKGLAKGGRILVIEPALLSTSRELIAVRNLLVERGWSVTAPCCGRDQLPCPALDAGSQHTCHEEVFWKMPIKVAELAGSMKLDKESLKMTWFLFAPPGVADSGPPSTAYRVVSDPLLNKSGRVRRLICGERGRFPLSAQRDSPDAHRCGFDFLKRGDFINVEKPEHRENGWGINTETKIVRL